MNVEQVPVELGEFKIATDDAILVATIAQGIALCVYDTNLKLACMAHYPLSGEDHPLARGIQQRSYEDIATGAVRQALRKLKSMGSRPESLQVSILGGGPVRGIPTETLRPGDLPSLERTEALVTRFKLKVIRTKFIYQHSVNVRFDSKTGSVYYSTLITSPTTKEPTHLLPKVTDRLQSVKVLIVDDSLSMRKILEQTLGKYSQLRIVGVAASAAEAEALRQKTRPDVMTLDIHMPEKDGVTYLSELMSHCSMPVIMVSDLSNREAGPVMRALELGAFDFVKKPMASEIGEMGERLQDLILAAYRSAARPPRRSIESPACRPTQPVQSRMRAKRPHLICIGASTGGTEALRKLFAVLPARLPPIVVVQHMPAAFTGPFANGLNNISRISTKEAQHGDLLMPNCAYIAPGGQQLGLVEVSEGQVRIVLSDDPPVNRFKPSVDFFFQSVAKLRVCKRSSAFLLTGMGDDGARGMLTLRNGGAFTVAQSEESCVVFGMPKAAIELNGVDEVLDLDGILKNLVSNVELVA
jgi:two-component system chemotaxis response regulator CheB